MRLLALYLVLMPCGASWSVNAVFLRWFRGKGQSTETTPHLRPAWGLRLLQIQMAIIFLAAGLEKVGDEAWLNGTAMYYVARLDDYFGRFPTPAWLFDNRWSVALLTCSCSTG
jgi:hypothetical protein